MMCVSTLGRCRRFIRWRVARCVFLSLLAAGCQLSSCNGSAPGTVAVGGTGSFLDPGDFDGSYSVLTKKSVLGGETTYNGRLVFSNLPRTVVDDVLPADLHLATNINATFPDVHPVILLYGDQTNATWVLPWKTIPIGASYKELIMLIPFVQHESSSKWYNYVVRMHLDNDEAILLGNMYYGYFKQKAVLSETTTTLGATTTSLLDVVHNANDVFQWTSKTTPTGFTASTTAVTTLENYKDAIEIMKMPLLGTLVDFGGQYICSYWEWDLQSAVVRPITVSSQFVKPPRTGTASWVSQGTIPSVDNGAFEIQGLNWQMGYPPQACSF